VYEQMREQQHAAERASRQAAREHDEQIAGITALEQATRDVHSVVEQLAAETSRAQRLAVWVGVGTSVIGAILGGFAGAIAARIVGGS
jgi:N-acetylmuramic acid 6-phosphate (MurNAc-6-P) etherase